MTESARSSREQALLVDLCSKHGIAREVVEGLFRIEKEYQLMERRRGVYDSLRECIRSSIGATRRNER